MITMKEILDSLPSDDRRKLQYAFENGLQQFVNIKGTNNFIGVYCDKNILLNVAETVGVWSTGTIKSETRSGSNTKKVS